MSITQYRMARCSVVKQGKTTAWLEGAAVYVGNTPVISFIPQTSFIHDRHILEQSSVCKLQ